MDQYANEVWKPIPEWEGIYSVSDMGRVRSEDRVITYADGRVRKNPGRIRKTPPHKFGYPMVTLKSAGRKQETWTVHRLVMLTFVGPCPEGMEVCHNNGDASDPSLQNLRYGTPSENKHDKRLHGTDHEINKTHCPRGHELKYPNLSLAKLRVGSRECLACARARSRVGHHAHLRPHFKTVADKYYAAIVI